MTQTFLLVPKGRGSQRIIEYMVTTLLRQYLPIGIELSYKKERVQRV